MTAAFHALAAGMLFATPALMAQAVAPGNADLEPGAPFLDNAILQREVPVPVWGWGRPDSTVTVAFAGQTKTATVGKNGTWMVRLDPLKASAEPAEMTISNGEGKKLSLNNILVGEVWHASGQSNMEWLASKSLCSGLAQAIAGAKEDDPYNWCVSPLTPMAVAGVVWVPGEFNIGYTPADYAAELEIHARSLPATYGQGRVPFLYAQPAGSLVEGITTPSTPGAKCLPFAQWPKSLKEIAAELGRMAGS